MRKSTIMPFVAMIGSVLAFFLRKNQLNQAKDPETLLYIPMASETVLLYLVVFAFLLGFAVFLLSDSRSLPNYHFMVYCPHQGFLALVASGAFFMVLSLLVGFLEAKVEIDTYLSSTHDGSLLHAIPFLHYLILFAVTASGGVCLLLGKSAYEGKELEASWIVIYQAFPPLLLLIEIYRDVASSPNLQDKIWAVLAGLALAHSTYHLAAASVSPPKANFFTYLVLSSTVIFGAYAGGDLSFYYILVGLGYHLFLLAFAAATIENAFSSRMDYRTPPVS